MSAETRAKEIVGELASRLMAHGWSEDVHHPLLLHVESLITQALHQAQNDKLEEAAAHFERYSAAFSGRSFAATLRSLKSKDTQ